MAEQQPNPNIPAHPIPFRHKLPNFSTRIAGTGPVKIVAIGSSSIIGEGGIVAYPHRLENALRAHYSNRMIDVLNRGKGGEEAPVELQRMQADVLDEKPHLVIWQVGTNAVWNGNDPDAIAAAIGAGLDLLHGQGADIVMMDLQFLPAVVSPDKIAAAERMVALIAAKADAAGGPVNVFRRFELMRQWHQAEKISFDRMIDPTDPNRLHHSDWSTERVAQALCDVIVAAAAPAFPPLPRILVGNRN